MDLPYLHKQLNRLNNEIGYILEQTGYEYDDMQRVEFSRKEPNARLLQYEFLQVMHHLNEVKCKLDYLNKKIVGEYTLRRNNLKQYECDEQIYHCGYPIEYYCYDDYDECYKWILSRVEHDGNDYYIVGDRSRPLNGLKVRIRR